MKRTMVMLGALMLAACADEEQVVSAGGQGGAGAAEGKVSYQQAIRPLIDQHCLGCHSEGGLSPLKFAYSEADWASGAPPWAGAAVAAVEAGRMPPWLPSDTCRPLEGSRRMAPAEVDAFKAWKAGGFARGDERDYKAPQAKKETDLGLGAPTFTLKPDEIYTASREQSDDYRCFILPQEFSEDTYLISSLVEPSDLSIAHHALLYLIPPASANKLAERDQEDPGPGYTCFGGPGGGALTTLAGWVPGMVQTRTPDNSAMVIPKGSRLVLQMHYNTLSIPQNKPVPPDQSKVSLWTLPAGQTPQNRVEMLPLAHLRMKIDALDPSSQQERVYTMPTDGKLVGLIPHMHKLGKAISARLEPGGSPEQCLVDIPRWDFNWQQQYQFAQGQQLDIKKGDRVRVSCTYDNSRENQPTINGQQKTSEPVTWGEGTLDEMCLLYVAVMVPAETPNFACGSFEACRKKCPEGDAGCFFDCTTEGGGQCANCVMSAIGGCAPKFCAGPGLAVQKCFADCDDPIRCLTNDCFQVYGEFYKCMEPHMLAGECNKQFDKCGVAY